MPKIVNWQKTTVNVIATSELDSLDARGWFDLGTALLVPDPDPDPVPDEVITDAATEVPAVASDIGDAPSAVSDDVVIVLEETRGNPETEDVLWAGMAVAMVERFLPFDDVVFDSVVFEEEGQFWLGAEGLLVPTTAVTTCVSAQFKVKYSIWELCAQGVVELSLPHHQASPVEAGQRHKLAQVSARTIREGSC